MIRTPLRIAAALSAMLLLEPAAAADLIFHGGPSYTGTSDRPTVEAVVVKDGRIVFAGSRGEAMEHREGDTELVDLAGAAMYPGFTDAHAHLFGIGMREMTLNLDDVGSIAELKARVEEAVAQAAPGETVFGRGWIETHWPEGRFPARGDLDPVSPDTPVFLVRADGHAAVVNSAGLEAAGITAETEAPFGGEILRGPEGRATGMLIDDAMDLAAGLQRDEESIDRQAAYESANEVYTRFGWTGLHNMSVPWADVALLERLSDTGVLDLRVHNAIDGGDADSLFASGPRASETGRIVTRAIKLYIDGALGSRGALLLEPYADAEGTGLLRMKKADAMPLLERALREGIQIATHAIGDRGNRLVLDWYAEVLGAVPAGERAISAPRWRIEHAQILDPADLPRFAELDVIASMQPSHAIGDLHFAPDRLGPARLEGAYAWKSLIESGALLVAGSDAPVEKGDPLIEFYAAVARRDLSGYAGPGWHPEEAVGRQTGLKMFTLWPAYAAFQEDELGTIETGKRADLTVFSADIMRIPEREIPKARAVMTIIDGEIAYRADAS